MVVDVGPANTAQQLISELEARKIFRLDYILITHIHIDHAGALGPLLARYPAAKAICHERALVHVVEPDKLWKGSLKVLGEVAETYGRPLPVERSRLIAHSECRVDGLGIVETPGHAPHHLSYEYNNKLFAGEAAGNYFIAGDTDYLRPATPPRFFLEVFISSIERLRKLRDQQICYAHFGSAASSHQMLDRFKEQVHFWAELIEREMNRGGDDLVERCVRRLLEEDQNLAAFKTMAPEVKARELNFMANAVKGFVGYFYEKS